MVIAPGSHARCPHHRPDLRPGPSVSRTGPAQDQPGAALALLRARPIHVGRRQSRGLAGWPDKVRILPRGLKLIGPEIDPEILNTVYGALLADRRFQCGYHPRDAEGDKDYLVNPLGLVVRDAVTYLVCTLWDYDDPIQLALHRIRTAEPLDTKARRPPGFGHDAYIRQGAFSMPFSDRPIRLEALFDADAAYHLRETKLSEDQVLEDQPDGRVLVKAAVQDTGELRWWTLGFGGAVSSLHATDLLA